MAETARPDPSAAAQRIKDGVRDLARGAVGAAGDLAADLAEGYRKSTRTFRLRAAIVGTWALLSVVTLWAACPSSGPTNALGAKVQVARVPLMGTQISIDNESSRIWTNVVVTIDADWRFQKKTVRPDDPLLVVGVTQFRRGAEGAPFELEPHEIVIECDEGRVRLPVARR